MIRAALGVIQGGWWTQEVANNAGAADHPFCLKCEPAVLGSAMHRLWTCPTYCEARLDLPPTHQHLGATATGDKLMWEKGLMHHPVERCTFGRTHDGTAHVWIHPNVRGSSFGGKLFVDGSLLSKYGAQGGQAGWAVAQVDETTHELVCSAHGAMPISLPVQRRIMRAELWALLQALTLSEPGAAFISDCAAVLRGLTRGEKWCTAGRRPHADVWREIWQRFRDIGREAQVDSVTKCKAHLTKAERAKLNDEGRLDAAGNEWADRLAKDGAGDDSFQAVLCDWYKTAARTCTDIITYIGNFILRAKTGDRWTDVTPPPQEWQEKDERWKRVKPTLANTRISWFGSGSNGAATSVAGTRVMVHQERCWFALSVLDTLLWRWETRQGLSCICWYRQAVLCGVADVELERPSSRRGLANRAWDDRGLRSMHEAYACCRMVGTPRRTDSMDRRSCSLRKRGPNGDWFTKESTWPKLRGASSDRQLSACGKRKPVPACLTRGNICSWRQGRSSGAGSVEHASRRTVRQGCL